MLSFSEQASWAKMTSPEGKLMARVCHPTNKVNKAEEEFFSGFSLDGSHFN
jgi:hypothetical protein